MIRRGNANKTPSVVNSAESETLSVNGGIVRNAGPNDLASVVDSCNFRLRDDGSYALRKPDVVMLDGGGRVIPLKDGVHALSVASNGTSSVGDLFAASGWTRPVFKYVSEASGLYEYTYGLEIDTSRGDYDGDAHRHIYVSPDARIVRAGDVTLIPARVDLTLVGDLVDETLYPTGTVTVPRLLGVYWEETPGFPGCWVVEIIRPEVNTLVDGGEGATFDPNLLLDNPYALRDLYGYGSVGVHGIVAYQDPNDSPVPGETYAEVSRGAVTKTFFDAVFGVSCRNGQVYVRTTAHITLFPAKALLSASATVSSAADLYAMDDDIVCYVGYVKHTDAGGTDRTLVAGTTERFSSVIPSDVALCAASLPPDLASMAGTLTVRVYLYASKGTADFHAYPGDVPLADAVDRDGISMEIAVGRYVEFTLEIDGDGNVVNDGFSFVYDDKGPRVEVDTAYSGAMLYAISPTQFESDDAAEGAAVPYVDGGSLSFDEHAVTWTYHYRTYNLTGDAYEGLDGLRVADLTESVKEPTFRMLARLDASDARPIVLKAMMSFSRDLSDYYGVWESSSDGGVSWQECDEFVKRWKGSLTRLPVVDASRSGETLQSSDEYVRYVSGVPISADSNQDGADGRVDVLPIWRTPRTRAFRFSVYRYSKPTGTGNANALAFVTYRSRLATPYMPLPTVSSVHVGSTNVLPYSTENGMFVIVPPSVMSQNTTLRYGVTTRVNAGIGDTECTGSAVLLTSDSRGMLFNIPESGLVPVDDRGFTHYVKVRALVCDNGLPIPGCVVEARYLYINRGIPTNAAAGLTKRMTFTEPIVRIESEVCTLKQVIDLKDNQVQNRVYDTHDAEDYTPSSDENVHVFGVDDLSDPDHDYETHFELDYRLSVSIHNPSDVPMPVALCVSEPMYNGDFKFYDSLDDFFGKCEATLTVDATRVTGSFSKYPGTNKRLMPPFRRGVSTHYAIVKPHTTVSVTYAQLFASTRANPEEAYAYLNDVRVWRMFCDIAYPLELVTPSGFFGIAKSSCVGRTPAYSALTAFHTLASHAYYDDTHICPVQTDGSQYAVDGKSFATPTWASAGVPEYVTKALLVSTLTHSAELVESETEYMDYADAPDLVHARHVYYEHLILTYGVEGHRNVLYVSDVDSYVTPLRNAIEFSYGSEVTAVIPWRDYVLVFTENATYMLLKDPSSPNGFSTRTVNSQVGVPRSDGDSVQAILNGILFKSGDRAYVYVPGRYSTVDTMLNIRRISDPVADLLHEGVGTLSFVQDDEWHLFQDDAWHSELVYNYSRNVWVRHTHPFFPSDTWLHSTSWRLLMRGMDKPVSYGRDYAEIALRDGNGDPIDLSPLADLGYGDYVGSAGSSFLGVLRNHGVVPSAFAPNVLPMPFLIDTGQKSARFTVAKQFLELKLNVMSLDDKDAFPLTLTVYADGMPHPHVVDANTDSPFWRESKTLDTGAAGTGFGDAGTSNVGIMRQMFVKYSGRGKTLRVTLSGESQSRFAVYTADSRYRVLPNKQ